LPSLSRKEEYPAYIPLMSSPVPPTIQTSEEVMFFDTDAGGVVHNIAYLRFIETARTRLGAKIGLSMKDMTESGVYAVVTRTEIDYKRPAVLGDLIQVDGHLEKIERARFWVAFEITRPSDGKLLVTCRQSLALVKLPEGKVQKLPEAWEQYRTE
jgi:YbgC/YbaW family acyl-CoA thioester hydrolase